MSHKNDVLPIFIKFQKYVERYFNLKIKAVQLDWADNIGLLIPFWKIVVLLIASLVHIHTNKMVLLNANTVI